MLKESWQKLKSRLNNPSKELMLQRGCYVGAVFVGFFYVISGINQIAQLTQTPTDLQAQIEVKIEEEKIDDESSCMPLPMPKCFDKQGLTDFLYEKNGEIAVIHAEEFNLALFQEHQNAAPLYLASISELIAKQVSFEVRPQVNGLYSELEQFDQSILDKIYEEELPNDVIEERKAEVHINNTDIKELKIIPNKKPAYFGPIPMIAIVIDDMGISQQRTRDIASLQAPLTASFLTYSHNLDKQIANSQNSGQEIMIHVPMEAQKKLDEAPDVLTTKMSNEEIKINLEAMLKKFDGIKGINNHMGSKLTEDENRMEAIMEVLKEKNLFFLDSKTSAKSKAEVAAKNKEVAYAHRHVFLDNNNDKAYILKQLGLAEKLAAKNGYAIAIGHPKSQTYAALKEWLATLGDKRIKLVPLSKIVNILN